MATNLAEALTAALQQAITAAVTAAALQTPPIQIPVTSDRICDHRNKSSKLVKH